MYYIFIENNKINGCGESKILSPNFINYEVSYDLYNSFKENPKPYIFEDNKITIDSDYETKQAQEKRAEIDSLKVTKRVFALALQNYGVTYSQLKELIATNEQAQLEWDLCVELERSNPLLDIMASQMGITSEQIDEIFIKANDTTN